MPQAEPTPVQTFDLPEEAVAEHLGLSRDQVRTARGPQGEWWDYGANRRILWSENGVAALRSLIAAPVDPVPPENEAAVPPAAVLAVWNPKVPNRRTLVAYRKGLAPENAAPDDRCIVYLGANGDNRRFVPGMEILARHHRGATWWFEGNPEQPENGRRMPRGVGRW